MPSKRSKSQEREKKRTSRAKMSDEEKIKVNERRRQLRKNKQELKDSVEREFDKIENKHNIRSWRSKRSEDQKKDENLKAKKGMQLLRKEGRIRNFEERTPQNSTEESDWDKYMKNSELHAEKVASCKPDIVQKLNQKSREECEKQRKKRELELEKEKLKEKEREENGGEYVFDTEYGDYIWIGEKETECESQDQFDIPPTEEELRYVKEQEDLWRQEEKEEKKKRINEKRRLKIEQQKKAMEIPIKAFPKKELCEYEKLRLKNIQEREDAMVAAGFYDDLHAYKKKIGLLE